MHTYTRIALQCQITESVERGYGEKNEVWRKEGGNKVSWRKTNGGGGVGGGGQPAAAVIYAAMMQKTERGPFINSWWSIIGTDMKSIEIWTRFRPEAL